MDPRIERLLRAQRRVRTRKPWIEAAQTLFRDDALMIGSPSCTAVDFEMPRLRRCPFDPDSLVLEASLGCGLDGYAWKVRFGDEGPFILKMAWPMTMPTA
jgi:hypothetical protein